MSKITLDNLSNNLKDYLENVGSIDPSVYQEKTDETLQTEDKTIVGAINELFQSANNGKELIASAIGEPLNAEDTFSAMSSDINGLLSTFKTNMMNSGIAVEAEDRFKQLIDKIKGLTEGEGNKGVQFASGTYDYICGPNESCIINHNSGFIPTYFFAVIPILNTNIYDNSIDIGIPSVELYDIIVSNLGECYLNPDIFNVNASITDLTENTAILNTFSNIPYSGSGSWYAIGVGEEDTTLRDSLASILTDEGVEVTEEDDMASLITKVDEEFDKQVVPAGDAVASDVLSGKTFMNNSGELLTGNVTKMSEYTQITSGNVNNNGAAVYISIPSGAYTTPSVLGKPEIFLTYADLDANLVPENIVSGKSICGVTGTAKTVPTIVSGTSNTIYTSEVKQYSSGIYSDSSNTWSTSWYIDTSDFDQLYMNYSNIKNVSITFQYMCDIGNIYAYCSNVILKKGYSTIATLCTSNCYIDDGGYWYNNVDPITVTLDQLNGATVQVSGAYCTSQPTYIVQVRYVIRGDIQ